MMRRLLLTCALVFSVAGAPLLAEWCFSWQIIPPRSHISYPPYQVFINFWVDGFQPDVVKDCIRLGVYSWNAPGVRVFNETASLGASDLHIFKSAASGHPNAGWGPGVIGPTGHLQTSAVFIVGSGNSGAWIPEILAPSPERLAD